VQQLGIKIQVRKENWVRFFACPQIGKGKRSRVKRRESAGKGEGRSRKRNFEKLDDGEICLRKIWEDEREDQEGGTLRN